MAGFALRKRFTCFKELPIDIRLMIWEAALPGPRLVTIRQSPTTMTFLDYKEGTGHEWPLDRGSEESMYTEEGSSEIAERARTNICFALGIDDHLPGPFYDVNVLGIRSNCPPPNITFVCWESNGVVSRHYAKAFAYSGSIPSTYFNFDVDTLHIRLSHFVHYFGQLSNYYQTIDGLVGPFEITDKRNTSKVQRVAITNDGNYCPKALERLLCVILSVFDGAKEVSLIAREQTWSPHGDWLGDWSLHGDSSRSSGDGCIVEPISVLQATEEYYSCQDDMMRGKVRQLQIPILPEARQMFSMLTSLEAKWKTSNWTTRLLPKIQVNSLVTPQALKDLNRAVALYKMTLSRHEQRMREDREAAGFCSDDALSDDEF